MSFKNENNKNKYDIWRNSHISVSGNVVFNFVGCKHTDLHAFARGYRRAGQSVLNDVMSKASYRDNDCYPIFFLYRHAIELFLKAIILNGAQLLHLINEEEILETDFICKTHRLISFIPALKAIFKDRGWLEEENKSNENIFNDICQLINSIDEVDPNSFFFRYPVDTKGQQVFPRHTVFNVVQYVRDIEPILDLLDGAVFALDEDWNNAAEVLYEVQNILKLKE